MLISFLAGFTASTPGYAFECRIFDFLISFLRAAQHTACSALLYIIRNPERHIAEYPINKNCFPSSNRDRSLNEFDKNAKRRKRHSPSEKAPEAHPTQYSASLQLSYFWFLKTPLQRSSPLSAYWCLPPRLTTALQISIPLTATEHERTPCQSRFRSTDGGLEEPQTPLQSQTFLHRSQLSLALLWKIWSPNLSFN